MTDIITKPNTKDEIKVSRITLSNGLLIAEVDGLPSSASRSAVGIVGSGSGSSDAPSLIKRCAVRSGHQGPVLAVLAMLATKRAAARGSARLCASLDGRCARRSVKA